MLIATVSSAQNVPSIFSQLPYVWAINFVFNTAGTYWETAFGAPHEEQLSTINVIGVSVNGVIYSEVSSLAGSQALEASWYWDNTDQKLWIHLDHDVDGLTAEVRIGKALGFSDTRVVNINDIEYLPMIKSVPSLSQVQDLVKYDRLALVNGEMVLNNVGGLIDYLKDENLIGGDARLFYLPDDRVTDLGEAEASDLITLASFYVEDYKPGVSEFRIALQDKRKSQDASFPQTRFNSTDYPDLEDQNEDLPIPLVYGYQRELKAYAVNGLAASTTVRYRAGLLLTALITVWIKVDDTWVVKIPSSIDLPNGEFSVANAKANASDGSPECRVEATGIAVTYASDVIVDLNERYTGVPFEDAFYDTGEWVAEQSSLSTIGIVFDSETTIYEAAQRIQAGANIGFRYEINAIGQRTIRIDRDDRELQPGADNVEILDPFAMLPEVDTEFLAAQVRIGYLLSNESGRHLTVLNDDYAADVLATYISRREVRFDTLLTNLTDAQARAALDATRFSVPQTSVSMTLRGERYLTLRLLDMLPIALTPDSIDLDTGELSDPNGRQFLGVQVCKVVGISPDFQKVQNKVTVKVVRPITPSRPRYLVYSDGVTLIETATGKILISGGQG